MTEDEKTAKIAALRGKLKDGRRASKASTDSGRYSPGAIREARSSLQEHGRTSEGSEGNVIGIEDSNQRNDNRQRGSTSEHIRSRRDSRRLSESNSGITDIGRGRGSGTKRADGRLETDDPIPERAPEPETPDFEFPGGPSLAKAQRTFYKEDYKRSRGKYLLSSDTNQKITPAEYKALASRKQTQQDAAKAAQNETVKPSSGHKLSFMKNGRTLTIKEAEELTEPLIAALLSDFEYLDKGIWLYSMSQDQRPIWSDMAREEVEVLASIMLKRGQRSPEAASAVRAIVDSDIYIQVGAITIPRAIKTYQAIKGSPRPMIQKQRRDARSKARKDRLSNVHRA
jgi:hypothetical protein